jgi:MFS family permease
MAIFAIGPLLSNTIGPLIAGPVGHYLGWRWLFRIIYISNFFNFCMAMIFMRETFTPLLLQRKAAAIRKQTGKPDYYTKHDHKGTPMQSLWLAICRPTKMLLFSPIVWSLSIYCAFIWGLLILLFTSFPDVFHNHYGFGQTTIGVAYIGSGIGMTIGAVSFGILSDKMAKKRKADESHTWTPESRLELMVWFAPVSPIGFFWYGWAVQGHAPAWVPIFGTAFIGMGALYIVMPVQMYLVDAFGPKSAASAIAANTVLRSLFGCFLPLAGPSLNNNLGLGWANTLLGGIGVIFCCLPILFYKYGAYVRTRWPIDV